MSKDFCHSMFEVILNDKEIKAWFLKEYATQNLDILILLLEYMKEQENNPKELVYFLIDLPLAEEMKNTLFLDFKNSLGEMQMEMFKEMMEAEGEDDFDEENITAPPTIETPEGIKALRKHLKAVTQQLWDDTLRSSLNSETILYILKSMNTKIFPKVSNPILFSDFIISAYDLIGNDKKELKHKKIILSIHALSSLFILLTNHGLDYTSINYYQKLYSLLDYVQNIFRMKEKEKFLRLMELSIKSPMLPSNIAASFMKKLLRVIISQHMSQAALSIWAISFVCNVIKKHPVCTKMINTEVQLKSNRLQRIEERKMKKRDRKTRAKNLKERVNPSLSGYIKKDIFDMKEKNPQKTHAIDTFLWEVLPFLNHSSKIVRDYA